MAEWQPVPDTPWPGWAGHLTLPVGSVHVWLASLEQPESALAELAAVLDPDERARADRYVRPVSRRQATVSRGLLRLLLGAYCGRDAAGVRLAVGPHGKPYLSPHDDPGGLRFNVSHAGTRVLYAFACGTDVGVDIEATDRVTNMAGVARRSFSPREFGIWQAADPDDQTALFFHFWSQKESVIKACGRGLLVPLDAFETPAAPNSVPQRVDLTVPDSAVTAWWVRSLDACPGYAAALCTAGAPLPVSARHLDGNALDRLNDGPSEPPPLHG